MRLKSDLLQVMLCVAEGRLDEAELLWDSRPAISIVATSEGYPGDYPTGRVITGIEKADQLKDVKVFHSGTTIDANKKLVTDGGRVLSVTALGDTIKEAQALAYKAMQLIHFEGMHYRKDIGHWAMK